ncbi:hypothetical protein RclHR1_05810014 [Rhizophagus clarus]|uniref:Phosphoinositide biosynthesis protein n=1 Tax=Rhizophagus clarus TaxID=94130 RepID=A0A2Z6S7J6_9GLOM|nr:hypothetical protein RclHR1_05810014 [Rhizophagus clarus]GES78098.1 phosphoinositide biosynthesis protein [Rhizophagus clarus]
MTVLEKVEKVEKVEKEGGIKFKKECVFELEKDKGVLLKRNLKSLMSKKFIIGCFYVLTVVLGSIYGSYQQKFSTSFETSSWFDYFNITHKSNLINQYFVKKGWFWTSIIFIIYSPRVIHANKPGQYFKFVIRWILATLYWYSITQRFFGPSIMDRIFVFTGGKCDDYQVFEAYACKKNGGRWIGGYDLSGHCFLLIHASLLLWEEITAFTCRPKNWEIAREKEKILSGILVFLLLLWWFMLVVTTIYFHNFSEKLTGTIFGVLYWIIYNYICYVHPNKLMPYDLKELEEREL